MSVDAASDFWEWSLDQYARAGVGDLLLQLQDDLDLDVNMLLWCGWCAQTFADLPDLHLRKAIDLTEIWTRDVAKSLRRARRALKTPPQRADREAAEALRIDVKALELKAERIEQAMLADLAKETLTAFPDVNGALPRARRNLTRYAALAGAVRKPGFSTLAFDALAGRMFPFADGHERLQG
jgi:uncharacterized protein (TIGR02444 family)